MGAPWKKRLIGFIRLVLIPGVLIQFGGHGAAADIFQWVDDAGKTHMSDVVPDKYKATAKRINSRKYELSDTERKNEEARVAKEKRRVERKPIDTAELSDEDSTPDLPSQPLAPLQQTTCTQKWDAYYRSQECFAQFMIRTGAGSLLKPEAYAVCQNVESPAMVCEYDKRTTGK
jgi:hypothetical protein